VDREIMAEIKKLSDRVQYLEDQLVKQRRENANLLEELDASRTSGISSSFVGAVDKKFSEIMQTEEKIQMTVADVSDEARKQYSKYEQTAKKIETEVADLWEEDENNKGDISKITQTATDITSLVMKMFAPAKTTTKNPLSDSSELDKNSLYLYGDNVFCYDDVLEEWRLIKDVTVSSSLKQTAFGFTINGNVRISGDVIVGGEITSTDFITSGGNSDLKLSGGAMTITETGNGNLQDYVFSLALSDSEHADLGAYQVNIQSKDDAAFLNFKKKVNFSDAKVTGLYAVFE
jgi:hypothetical protein